MAIDEPEQTTIEPASDAAPAGNGDDALTAVLRQFEQETGATEGPVEFEAFDQIEAERQRAAGIQQEQGRIEDLQRIWSADDAMARVRSDGQVSQQLAETQARLADLTQSTQQFVQQINAERWHAREQADFGTLVTEAKQVIDDFAHIPEDFAQRYLIAESALNPDLKDAFDHRNDSAQARHHFNNVKETTLRAIRKAAASALDPEATEDRNMVVAAVRGATSRAPEDAPPNYSGQSNAEFRKTVKERYGFDAGV